MLLVPQTTDTPAQFGALVRRARENAGKTQQSLAEQAGISLRTLSRIESGEDTLVGTLSAIAAALDMPVADLLPKP